MTGSGFTNLAKQPKKRVAKSLAYLERVNRAIDFILQHLDQAPRLEDVARVACFSPFHFHRIFRLLMGESLNAFVKRVRLERALTVLSRKEWVRRRQSSLTDIAFACGFASSSDFSRCFKQRYGVAPSQFDVESFRLQRREDWQTAAAPEHRHLLDKLKPGANPDGFKAGLRRLPARTVAYIRVQNPFGGNGVVGAAQRLVSWAEARGLAGGQWLGYMWDDPEIVAFEDCRYDVGVEVPAATPDGEVCLIKFPAMQVAEVEVRGGIELEIASVGLVIRDMASTKRIRAGRATMF